MSSPSGTAEALKLAESAHTALTVFDLISTICDNYLRGPAVRGSARDIAAIQRIALRQRAKQLDILDGAEHDLV